MPVTGVLTKTPVDIPNGIYSIGEKLNLIENVLKNSNDNATKWIASKPWTFTIDFTGNIHTVLICSCTKLFCNRAGFCINVPRKKTYNKNSSLHFAHVRKFVYERLKAEKF